MLPLKSSFFMGCVISFRWFSRKCSLHILPRVSVRYIFWTFSRRYTYFFRNENMKNICENFTSNICWLGLKILFFMKMNCDIYLEYLLITTTFLQILPRISAHYYDIFVNFASNICSLQQIFASFTSNICSSQ